MLSCPACQLRAQHHGDEQAACQLTLLSGLDILVMTLAHSLGNLRVNHYSRLEVSPGNGRIFYVMRSTTYP
jgi:hypothetical protein